MNIKKIGSALLLSLTLVCSAHATPYFNLQVGNGGWPGEIFIQFCHLNAIHEDVPELFDNMILECTFNSPTSSAVLLDGRFIHEDDNYHHLSLGFVWPSDWVCWGYVYTTGLSWVRWRQSQNVDTGLNSAILFASC